MILSIPLMFLAIGTLCLSGVPALFRGRSSMAGQRCSVVMLGLGSILGLCAVGMAMMSATGVSLDLPWFLPVGRFSISIDALSAVFLVPVFIVPSLGAVYGLEYWKQTEHPDSGRRLGLFYGLLAGAMAMVVISRDGVLFLIAWEIMAVSAFFAATTQDEDPSVRSAGWVYLIATHIGTLCLIAMFTLLSHAVNSFALQPFASGSVQPAITTGIFVLAVIGFGLKAGIVPLHVWLPEAHANAPGHVSAVMSGVMLKMGVYGIIRIAAFLPAPPTWYGGTLLAIGVITGLPAIASAIAQSDLKRMLAYSSIENIGIMMMGVGLALTGRSLNRPEWIVLGLGGALFHMLNHSLFKSLLFLNAGAVIHKVHTRNMNLLGGLAGRMPQTAVLFLAGAVAICALPPLNGFVGEWLIYLGLIAAVGSAHDIGFPAAALGVAALAMIGALAVVCFVKSFGVIFLGEARTETSAAARDPGALMLAPPALLAAGCLVLGLFPWPAALVIDRAVTAWSGLNLSIMPIHTIVPMHWISMMGLLLLGSSALGAVWLKTSMKRRTIGTAGTWDCGYARPTSRMQYTGSSFGQSIVSLFAWALLPGNDTPRISGAFPQKARFRSYVPDAILDLFVLPVFRFAERSLPWLRLLQQGRIQIYVAYFLAAVLILLFRERLAY